MKPCAEGDVKCKTMRARVYSTIIVLIILIILFGTGCGCAYKWMGKDGYIRWLNPWRLKMFYKKCMAHKCPSCGVADAPPPTKCPECKQLSDSPNIKPCPKCEQNVNCEHCELIAKMEKHNMCGRCGIHMPKNKCSKCGACDSCNIDFKCGHCQGSDTQTSLHERQNVCPLCEHKPCNCKSTTGMPVLKEPTVARNGVYSSCLTNMVYL